MVASALSIGQHVSRGRAVSGRAHPQGIRCRAEVAALRLQAGSRRLPWPLHAPSVTPVWTYHSRTDSTGARRGPAQVGSGMPGGHARGVGAKTCMLARSLRATLGATCIWEFMHLREASSYSPGRCLPEVIHALPFLAFRGDNYLQQFAFAWPGRSAKTYTCLGHRGRASGGRPSLALLTSL